MEFRWKLLNMKEDQNVWKNESEESLTVEIIRSITLSGAIYQILTRIMQTKINSRTWLGNTKEQKKEEERSQLIRYSTLKLWWA